MFVAKLSTGEVVQFIKLGVPQFSEYEMALVANNITTNVRKIYPRWVPALQIVWIKEY